MRAFMHKPYAVGAFLGLVILATLTVGLTDLGHSQQRPRVSTPSGEDIVLSGNHEVRLRTAREGEIVFEQVRRVTLKRDWAILEVIEENDNRATLAFPREEIFFLKSWPVKAEKE